MLLFLYRNSAFSDADLNAGRVFSLLIILIAKDDSGDCEHTNDEKEYVSIHNDTVLFCVCVENRNFRSHVSVSLPGETGAAAENSIGPFCGRCVSFVEALRRILAAAARAERRNPMK